MSIQRFYVRRREFWIVVACAVLSALLLTIALICVIRQVRRRRRNKRQHFSRLVTDLNATEKFSIAAASDEDELSD